MTPVYPLYFTAAAVGYEVSLVAFMGCVRRLEEQGETGREQREAAGAVEERKVEERENGNGCSLEGGRVPFACRQEQG